MKQSNFSVFFFWLLSFVFFLHIHFINKIQTHLPVASIIHWPHFPSSSLSSYDNGIISMDLNLVENDDHWTMMMMMVRIVWIHCIFGKQNWMWFFSFFLVPKFIYLWYHHHIFTQIFFTIHDIFFVCVCVFVLFIYFSFLIHTHFEAMMMLINDGWWWWWWTASIKFWHIDDVWCVCVWVYSMWWNNKQTNKQKKIVNHIISFYIYRTLSLNQSFDFHPN